MTGTSKNAKVKSALSAPSTEPAWLTAFRARTDLAEYGDNALALFALALRFNVEDLITVAADAITDGSDDKKCDLVYIDRDDERAVIAQCYMANPVKGAAPSNKASDLNTALNWLLLADVNELPDRIRFAAIELREGLKSGVIKNVNVWFVHNCPESKNVADKLRTVEKTGLAALKSLAPDQSATFHTREVGQKQFEEWYNDTQTAILVADDFTVLVDAGFPIAGPNWQAFVTSIPLQFLRSQYQKHQLKLFSANVRDYLGSISSDANINNGIKRTAETDAANFWPYNNGVTILTNGVGVTKLKFGRLRLKISGMSIINGAQTTGALGTLTVAPAKGAQVAARFIQTKDQDVLSNTIRYNNSQNKVAAADFRSTDQIQKRLKRDMAAIPSAEYDGGRRGGLTDAIRRRPNLLPAYTVGQALAAFHGDATVAYNQKSDIWIDDGLYTRYFNEQTTASHIVFAYSLLRAVEQRKTDLIQKSKEGGSPLTSSEERQLAFFRRRGSTFLFVTAMSACLEGILGRAIPNRFRLSFGVKLTPSRAQQHWAEIVETYLPLASNLEEAFTYGLQNQERLRSAVATFSSLVEVTAKANKSVNSAFAKVVVVS